MKDLGRLIWSVLLVLLRSRAALAAENLLPRQQINVLRRTAPKRPFLSNVDRRGDQPFQRRKTFLRNHADGIVAMDLFVVRSGCSSAFSSCGMTGAAFYGWELPRTDRRLDCSPADGGIRLGSGFRGTSSAIETGLTAT
jgi:hypothetical protein